MIAFGSHNQLQSSLAPLGDLLKALMFLSNLNGFNSSPSLPVQAFNQRKSFFKMWKEKGSKWLYHFSFSLFLFLFLHNLCVLLFILSQSSFYVLLCLTCFCLVIFQFCFIFFHTKKKKKIRKLQNQCFLCILVLVYLGWLLKQNFLNFVFLVA